MIQVIQLIHGWLFCAVWHRPWLVSQKCVLSPPHKHRRQPFFYTICMTSKRPNVRASRQGLVQWENCCVSLAQSETCCSLQQFLYVHDRMSGVRSCLSDPVKFKFLVWWPVCWVHVYRYTAKLSKDDLCGVEGLRGRAVGGQADRQGGPAREEEGCSWPAAGQATCGALRSRRNGGKHSHPVPTMLTH